MRKLTCLWFFGLAVLLPNIAWQQPKNDSLTINDVKAVLNKNVMAQAEWAMRQQPITITAQSSARSAGGKHDFYSEGDYWWPDPKDPSAPYIQKDGLTNPDNFTAHRLAMIRFSQIIGALASAYKLTHQVKYIKQASLHLRAWFANPETLMNPNLQYAQAIKGLTTGRGIGIIDTIQLMEVAQGVMAMEGDPAMDKTLVGQVRNWFIQYLSWLTTSKNGLEEKAAKNNHGTCWTMQVACFARFTKNKVLTDTCINRFKNILLPNQMAADGSLPLELKRTKPYGYSIFDLDALATLCQILSTPENNLWNFYTPDGKGIKKGVEYLYPYLFDKSKWPFRHDVMYWDEWPVAQPSLLFGAFAYLNNQWFSTWKSLNHNPTVPEVIRNLPVRNPLIWLN
ncbi:alginate lyase [Mucilaginibacter gracilis]|uniref:Alginate lyase n=1 Tax=Mucilaginibacter gracilis TaxID=423350 RepID=A0A495J4R9_9SPHI|nr:alginate lyase family protein [Mucilaginibacter gracilis]RKR83701.1 alginate lyase [Mucilaginibacter gracilis]